jgi:Holliday junction resolvase
MNYYKRGADYERRIVKAARDRGMIAFRSAGSHSPIDLCIIDMKQKRVYFVQCKTGKQYEKEKKKLEEKYQDLTGFFMCSFDVR